MAFGSTAGYRGVAPAPKPSGLALLKPAAGRSVPNPVAAIAAGKSLGSTPITKAAAPAAAAPKTGTPGTPAKTVTTQPVVQPFLTPLQEAAQQKMDSGYQDAIATALGTSKQYGIDEQQAMATNIHGGAVSNEAANSLAAARGVFGSGVNANDLADIATKLATANHPLTANLAVNQNHQADLIKQDQYNQGIGDAAYTATAVGNAAGTTPPNPVTTTTPAVPGTGSYTPPAPAAPAAPKPPAPVPAKAPGLSGTLAGTGAWGGRTGAAAPAVKPPPNVLQKPAAPKALTGWGGMMTGMGTW
jgi:hypothetical protein